VNDIIRILISVTGLGWINSFVQHPCFTGFASLVSFVLGSRRSGDVDRNLLFTGEKNNTVRPVLYIAMSMCNSFKCASSALQKIDSL
jgi:hypothetical protein